MKLFKFKNDTRCYSIHDRKEGMICFEEFENDVKWEKGIPYAKNVKEIECVSNACHVLLSSSRIDEKWAYYNLKDRISKYDRVCVLAFSFYDDTKNLDDWNRQYKPGQGIFYHENTDIFFKYGIKLDQICWVNYFMDSKEEMISKIKNSSILLLTGGAPDLMMKRIKEKGLKRIIKEYKGMVIGYSAGAMIQFDSYHITPDEDYHSFSYQTGLGYISGFDIEVHYCDSKKQRESIQKVKEEKQLNVYGIGEDGGIIVDECIHLFGYICTY